MMSNQFLRIKKKGGKGTSSGNFAAEFAKNVSLVPEFISKSKKH